MLSLVLLFRAMVRMVISKLNKGIRKCTIPPLTIFGIRLLLIFQVWCVQPHWQHHAVVLLQTGNCSWTPVWRRSKRLLPMCASPMTRTPRKSLPPVAQVGVFTNLVRSNLVPISTVVDIKKEDPTHSGALPE